MKKASLFASAAAASLVLAAGPVFAQASGPFADVPTDHWAYQSVDKLQKRGVVIGYPDGTFGGKRAMTRYEFAVAIARLVEMINTGTGTPGPAGPAGPAGPQGPAGVVDPAILAGLATKDEVANIRRLVTEFQNELTTLGVEVDNVKRRLDGLEGRVKFLEEEMKRVKIGGSVNLMARGNNRRGDSGGTPFDADGFPVTANDRGSVLSDSYFLHDVDLDVTARLSDVANAKVKLNFGNYLPFLQSVTSFQGARGERGGGVTQAQDVTVWQAMIETPLKLWGLGGVNLAVGRVPVQFTPWTLKLIDVDSYFNNEKTDLGDIPMDGVRGGFKLGPVGITAIAGKVNPIAYAADTVGTTGSSGGALFAGAGRAPLGAGIRPVRSLIEQGRANDVNAMPVDQLAGVRATLGTGSLGTIGVSYLALGGDPTASTGTARATFDRVFVYGADINANFGSIGVNGSYTVSNTASAAGESGGDTNTVRDDDTYAWEAGASWTSGGLMIGGGYQHIAPYFAAPGYWGKIGAWTNPTDVKGPFVKASYALGSNMTLAGDAHFYEGTGDGNLSEDDGVNHFRIGLKYGLTSASSVDLGVENARYEVAGFGDKPTETYYNIGYGFSFNPSTSFKFLYQIIDFNGKGVPGFEGVGADGGVAAAQFSVKF